MPDPGSSFQSLPPEYLEIIQLAEKQLGLSIQPLQELVGGWSGAAIYLVRVAAGEEDTVLHLVMKVDRKSPLSSSDEISRHLAALAQSPPDFAEQHIPEIAFERVESEDALLVFYAIAGQSLHRFRTLSSFQRQDQLETLFSTICGYLLSEWNARMSYQQVEHPQRLLKRWLGFRLNPDQKIEQFIRQVCKADPEIAGFLVQGSLFPNPLYFARHAEKWPPIRGGDAVFGLQHSDLNTNNIIARFKADSNELLGFYLIDFALFKSDMPLLYDLRYLEMSYLVHTLSNGSFDGVVDLVLGMSEDDLLEARQVPVGMVGVNAAIRAGRQAFDHWISASHPSLQDDLWGQYWLAGAAAGLSFCHKAGQPEETRLAGLIYAAANIKRYFKLFGLGMPSQAVQLYAEGQFGSTGPSGKRPAPAAAPNNLPAAPTNFVGRSAEMADLQALLLRPDVRIVTLTGPGGTGKTRLGMQVGRTMLENFPDGVFFIDLSSAVDPSLVLTFIAHTLGAREGGSRPALDNLKDFLAGKNMLLVLDNFEQVVQAAAILAELLAALPGLKTLVTSRTALQLRAEREFPVPPLEVPNTIPANGENVLEFEAVALFRQQARAVRPDFEVTGDNFADVIEICRRVDGLPLAIEIAAARIKMLAPRALLERLDQRLTFLVGGPKDLPARQQTLRQTIQWSYDLLEPPDQRLLVGLGVFSGGFTLQAAEEVCGESGELDVFGGIETLLNNSLLRKVESTGEEPRFDMLQTIRDFAVEIAEQAGLLYELKMTHMGYFAALAGGEMAEGIQGADSVRWLQIIDQEHDNFRSALSWALNQGEQALFPVTVIMGPLPWFWYRYGYLKEGREWTDRMVEATARLGRESPLRAMSLGTQAYLALWAGDLDTAARQSQESVALARALDFDFLVSLGLLCLGTARINQGRDREAYPHLVEAVELFDQQDQDWMKGTTLVHLANVSLGLGDPDQALQWLDMAMPVLKKVGDPWNLAFALNNYGEVFRAQGDYEKAEGYYRRTEKMFEEADARGDQARLVHTLGYLAMHKGDFGTSETLFKTSLKDFLELGNQRGIAECLAGLAGLAVERGDYPWAAPLLRAAEEQLKAIGGAWWPADRVEIERSKNKMKKALAEQFDLHWEKGQGMDVGAALAYIEEKEV